MRSKWLTAAELTLVVLIFLAQKLLKILPISETPYLFLLGWLSLRLRREGWRSVGLARPDNWGRTMAVGLGAGIVIQLLSLYVTNPLLARLTGQPVDLSLFKPLVGNFKLLGFWLLMSWTLAAFGEEMVYRGYLLNRAADSGNRAPFAWAAGLFLTSIMFAFGHYYQGVTGMVDTGIFALILGGLYLFTGKNLWIPILAHGVNDTIGFVLIYLNRYPGM